MSVRRTVTLGSKFNRLTILALAGPADHRQKLVRCRCDCGTERVMDAYAVVHGKAKSCGCLKRESARQSVRKVHEGNRTHGLVHSGTYRTWQGMVDRCRNARNPRFSSYGGRWITVCERWLKFEGFLADMGQRPQGKSIDRIDNGGNYESSNCRWATPTQQQRNMRGTTYATYRGLRQVLRDLCDAKGLSHEMVRTRIRRGWDVARAIETPVVRKVKA